MSDDWALDHMRSWRLDPDAGQLPYRRFASFVHDAVVRGELDAGAVLPPERELAALTGLGRATVARALRELADTGLLERRVGHGTVVAFDAHSWQAGPTAGIAWGALLTTLASGRPVPCCQQRRRAQISRTVELSDRDADTVLFTANVEEGTRFMVDALVRAGERVIVETPASSALKMSLAMRGAEVLDLSENGGFTSELEQLLTSRSGAKLLWLRASSALCARGDRAHVAGITKRLSIPVIEEPPSARAHGGLLEVEPHGHVIQYGDDWISAPTELASPLGRLADAVGLGGASDG